MFSVYNGAHPMLLLAQAVVNDILPIEKVPEELRPRIRELMSIVE